MGLNIDELVEDSLDFCILVGGRELPEIKKCHDVFIAGVLLLLRLFTYVQRNFELLGCSILTFRVLNKQGTELVAFASAIAHVHVHSALLKFAFLTERGLVEVAIFIFDTRLNAMNLSVDIFLERVRFFLLRLAVELNCQFELALQAGLLLFRVLQVTHHFHNADEVLLRGREKLGLAVAVEHLLLVESLGQLVELVVFVGSVFFPTQLLTLLKILFKCFLLGLSFFISKLS